jgi:hypothetical protein
VEASCCTEFGSLHDSSAIGVLGYFLDDPGLPYLSGCCALLQEDAAVSKMMLSSS